MTRRIDWRDGLNIMDTSDILHLEDQIDAARKRLHRLSVKRKRVISRCYARARRAAKGGK